jgi:hypothetical protein
MITLNLKTKNIKYIKDHIMLDDYDTIHSTKFKSVINLYDGDLVQ